MFRKPASQLHLPLLALLVLALIISIATLVCAATTLHLFESQQRTNPWLLPVWRNHFDLRGLKLVVGTSAAIALFDLVAIVALSLLAVQVSSNVPIELFVKNEIAIFSFVPVADKHGLHHSSSQCRLASPSPYQRLRASSQPASPFQRLLSL